MPDAAPDTSVQYEGSPKIARAEVRQWAADFSGRVAGGRGFACLIASAERLRVLNREFRGKDEATDVLSFPAAAGAGYLGDLAISLGHAREQARERGHAVETEVAILMLHGVLHLLGMDHETDRGQMRRAEAKWRREFGLPESLTERAQGSVKKARR